MFLILYILVSTFPHWISFSVPLATWRAAPGGVDEYQICGWCAVCCCISGWWAEQMTMNCISPNEAQISIYIIYMLLLSATNLCLCQHQQWCMGLFLSRYNVKWWTWALTGRCWVLGGGGVVGLQFGVWLTRAWQTMSAVSSAGQPTSSRRGEPDCTWTHGLGI